MRITDLLDDYWDSSVKLRSPEEIFGEEKQEGQPPLVVGLPQKKSRGQKAVLIAASLVLALTGIFAGALAISNLKSGGGSLAEGMAVPPSAFGTQAPEEPEMAPSIGEDDFEDLAPQAGIVLGPFQPTGFWDIHLQSYVQREDHISMELTVDVPPEELGDSAADAGGWTVTAIAQGTVEYQEWDDSYNAPMDVEVPPTEALSNVRFEAFWSEEDNTLHVVGDVDMSGQTYAPAFHLLISQGEDGPVKWISRPVQTPYVPQAGFAMGSDDHHIFDYEDEEFSAGITDFWITQDREITITIDYPCEQYIGRMEEGLQYWADLLMEKLGSTSPRTIAIYTEAPDGTWTAVDIDFSQVSYTIGFPQSDDGLINVDCSAYDFDPEQVVNIEFHSSMSVVATFETEISAMEDTDGDGIIETVVDLGGKTISYLKIGGVRYDFY